MKKYKSVFYILMFLPSVLACIAYPFLPDQVPAHYGASGMVDRYGSRMETFILPLFVIPFGLFLLAMARRSGKEESDGNANNQKIAVISGIMALLVFNVLTVILLYTALGRVENLYAGVDIGKILFSLLGVVFIVIGSLMPKLKRNSLIGLRTKWSLSSDRAWRKSQKFGGVSLMIAGAVLLAGNALLFHDIQVYIFSAAVVAADLIADVAYTYRISRQEGGRPPAR